MSNDNTDDKLLILLNGALWYQMTTVTMSDDDNINEKDVN